VRGKEATFKCTIREISAKEVSELDDEFVKDISEFDTLDELKEDVRKGLTERNQEVRDLDLEREVAEKVADLTEVEVPQVMYEDRIDDMAREWANKHQMPVEEFAKYTGKTTEEYREDFREIAEKQVRFRLALDKIAEIEELQVSDEELEEEFEKIAKENRMTVEKVRSIAPEAGVRADLKAAKAMDLIKETAIIKDKAKQEQSDQGLIDDKTGIEIEAEFKEA
jgi:trigger factor